ncbi:MAG: hypothetical protein ACK5HS_04990 [Mycoplasmatales bacterium]
MKIFKIFLQVMIVISIIVYGYFVSQTYSINLKNEDIQTKIDDLQGENAELSIQITTTTSRTEAMKKNKKLELRDNLYYLQDKE